MMLEEGVVDMKFGSKSYFDYMAANISIPESEYMYMDLCQVLRKDIFHMIVSMGVRESERESVFEDVCTKVISSLVDFLQNSSEKTDAQRNSWLKKTVRCVIYDHFRRECREYDVSSLEQIVTNGEMHIQYVSENSIEELEHAREVNSDLTDAIADVCALNTTPDKIIAFFLNCYECICGSIRQNGSPKQICEEFNGKTLHEAAETMKKRMQDSVAFYIPAQAYRALDDKIAQAAENNENAYFSMSPKMISDATRWIHSKLAEKRSENTGEPY